MLRVPRYAEIYMPVTKTNLKQLHHKNLAFLGLGIENMALIKFIFKHKIKARITICDMRAKEALGERYQEMEKLGIANANPINWKFLSDGNKGLFKFDILFRSPGWPLFCPGVEEAQKAKVEISSPMKLFFAWCPTKHIIGVTGTKGKGTTSTLIYNILKTGFKVGTAKRQNKRVYLGGNIGVAPFEFIDKLRRSDWVVLELSSFQLEDMEISPRLAVLTNFSPEHLAPADPNNGNYHKSLRAYWMAKVNIFGWQDSTGAVFINENLSKKHMEYGGGAKFFFKRSALPSRLIGEHNKENIAAAVEVAKFINIKKDAIVEAVAKYKGLEHRLEFVCKKNKIDYFNDTFATTPESAITALKSFSNPIVLIAGGADKGSDFLSFAKEINKRVRFTVLLEGDGTKRILHELRKVGYPKDMLKTAKSMDEAIKLAQANANEGNAILLSPGCASFGMFKNYKERGKLFKLKVMSF